MEAHLSSSRGWLLLLTAVAVVLLGFGVGGGSAPDVSEAAPARVVAGFAEVDQAIRDGKIYARILPLLVWEGGRYRDVSLGDELYRAGYSTRVLRKSVLNRVKEFALYQAGKPVGRLRVRRIGIQADGCGPVVAAGYGSVAWTRIPDFSKGRGFAMAVNSRGGEAVDPRERTGYVETRQLRFDATSPRLRTQDFCFKNPTLTPAMKQAAEDVARKELAALVAGKSGRRWGIVPTGELQLTDADIIDIERDGIPEVVVRFVAPLREPRSDSPGFQYGASLLHVVRMRANRTPSVLLSLPSLPAFARPGPESGDYKFITALDVAADGLAELLLSRTFHEAGSITVFEMNRGRLKEVPEDFSPYSC